MTGGDAGGASTALSWITDGLTNLWTVFNNTLSTLTNNVFFQIILVSALVYVALRLIKKAKKAAK